MKKYNLLFVMTSLRKGGISTSLVNLLNLLSENPLYEITLFLFDDNKIIDYEISKKIKIIYGNKFSSILSNSVNDSKRFGIIFYLIRLFISLFSALFTNAIPYYLLFSKFYNFQKHNFDLVISFTQSSSKRKVYGGCNEYVIYNFNKVKKLTFIHTDILKHGINNMYTYKILSKFNFIATVSYSLKEQLLKILPDEIGKKLSVVENINDIKLIENFYYNKQNDGKLRILTISRLTPEKGIDFGIEVINKLRNLHNIELFWSVVGDGSDYDYLVQKVNRLGLGDCIKFYGKQINPFPFFKNTDLFFLPSKYEGAPMVIDEAKMFGCYIISTNTVSAKEMVSEEYGLISDFSVESSVDSFLKCFNKNLFYNYFNQKKHIDFIKILTKRKENAVCYFEGILTHDNNY